MTEASPAYEDGPMGGECAATGDGEECECGGSSEGGQWAHSHGK